MLGDPPDVMKVLLVLFGCLLAFASCTVYFKDTFEDGGKYTHIKKCATCPPSFLGNIARNCMDVSANEMLLLDNLFLCCLEAWSDRWIQSTKRSDYGAFKLSAGKFYGDAEKDKGEQFILFCCDLFN